MVMVSLIFSMFIQCSLILTPKEEHMYALDFVESFAQEHQIDPLVSIGDLKIYKTENENYIKYKKTFENLFDIEQEQVYSVGFKDNGNGLIFVQQPGESEFFVKETEQVPWHLDRITKRHLPLDNTFPYNFPGSCHRNSNVDIETIVVDTGCDTIHPEFEGNRPEFLENFSGDKINKDCNSHGTFCSSQIGGKSVGVCKDAKIKCVKVLDCDGSGSTSSVISGLNFAFNRHIQNEKGNPKLRTIISMSLGGGYSLAMNKAITKMVTISDTFYMVVASGNENQDAKKTSPASADGILTANAMDKDDNRAYFSNFGKSTHIYSPGVSNYGAVLDGKYDTESGTSFSTPIVAGVMNHILDENPSLNMKQLKEKILSDATKDTIKGNPKKTLNKLVYLKRNDDN